MNINQSDCSEPKASKEARRGSKARKHGTKRGSIQAALTGASNLRRNDLLTAEARRLLTALGFPEARALVDPTDESEVILQKRTSGISVGAGRFSRAAAEALGRHDLACWQQAATGQKILRLTEAGRAHLRRAESAGEDAAFFHQHRETVEMAFVTDSGAKRVRVDMDESPLDWLRRRKGRDGEPLIDEASYQAGERLRTDIMLAGLLPGVTARWDDSPRSGGPASPSDATDRMIAARQRIRNAFDAIGADFSDLLMDLCGFLKGLELIERERHWPPRSAKIVIRLALARLAEHYGIEAAAKGPAASRGIRAWKAVVIEGGLG
jgi:Domain of unknown function (DUF6456)